MDLALLKSRLSITHIAHELGITPSKNGKAICPFHNDKTPSLQFSEKKQICTCFSSNCDAGTMDVIALVQKVKGWELPRAIAWLADRVGMIEASATKKPSDESIDYADVFVKMQGSLLASTLGKKYLAGRDLDGDHLEVGYNAFKKSRFPFLRGCVVFPLKDRKGKVVSLYGRSVRNNDKAKHYYTANRKGLYPGWPAQETTRLILTESVIDAISLNQDAATIRAEALALFGTNGLTGEHKAALQRLPKLEELVLFFDGDEAGRAAVERQGQVLRAWLPHVKLSVVQTPDYEDVNSLVELYGKDVLGKLIAERKDFFLSEDRCSNEEKKLGYAFDTSNPHKIIFTTQTATYTVRGGLRKELDSLKITLEIESPSGSKLRDRVELFQYKQAENLARAASEKLQLRADLVEQDLNQLADLLDAQRNQQAAPTQQPAPQGDTSKCLAFLKRQDLLQDIGKLIGKAGVVGEAHSRLMLFVIASSYKMQDTLHALIQGSSGSGKTHLLASIMQLMPPEDRISLTRITESSLYNYGERELSHKLIGIEDYDGLEEKAELAFRELQSKGEISSSTSGKDEQTGKISGFVKVVRGPIASLSATTRGEVYEDNMSRCFLIAVDESLEQTQRIIAWQNARSAGAFDRNKTREIQTFLQQCMRLIKPHEVVNPFATKIHLPPEAHKLRRLNELFQSFIRQVTLLNQYQRKQDGKGRLITEQADIATAIEIMFESIVLKVDELDGSLRAFYEELKHYVAGKGREYAFNRLEIRQALNLSKTRQHRYMNQLLELEYIQQVSGFSNRGYCYKIRHWDDNSRMRQGIRQHLEDQLQAL